MWFFFGLSVVKQIFQLSQIPTKAIFFYPYFNFLLLFFRGYAQWQELFGFSVGYLALFKTPFFLNSSGLNKTCRKQVCGGFNFYAPVFDTSVSFCVCSVGGQWGPEGCVWKPSPVRYFNSTPYSGLSVRLPELVSENAQRHGRKVQAEDVGVSWVPGGRLPFSPSGLCVNFVCVSGGFGPRLQRNLNWRVLWRSEALDTPPWLF